MCRRSHGEACAHLAGGQDVQEETVVPASLPLGGLSLTGVSEESKNKAPGNASLPGLCDLLVLEGILNFSEGNKKSMK